MMMGTISSPTVSAVSVVVCPRTPAAVPVPVIVLGVIVVGRLVVVRRQVDVMIRELQVVTEILVVKVVLKMVV